MFDQIKMRAYVRVKYSWLFVRLVSNQGESKSYENDTTVAIQTSSKGELVIASVGKQPTSFSDNTSGSTKICNAFDHKRTAIKEFGLACATLKYFIEQAYGRKLLFHPELAIVHP